MTNSNLIKDLEAKKISLQKEIDEYQNNPNLRIVVDLNNFVQRFSQERLGKAPEATRGLTKELINGIRKICLDYMEPDEIKQKIDEVDRIYGLLDEVYKLHKEVFRDTTPVKSEVKPKVVQDGPGRPLMVAKTYNPEKDYGPLSNALKDVLGELNMSPTELAKEIGCTRKDLYEWLQGKVPEKHSHKSFELLGCTCEVASRINWSDLIGRQVTWNKMTGVINEG